jgi:hypothetical protein
VNFNSSKMKGSKRPREISSFSVEVSIFLTNRLSKRLLLSREKGSERRS